MNAQYLTYYSAIVSTISLLIAVLLAVLRIREYFRDNRGITVSHYWTGNPDASDFIYLTNLSSTPVLIDHWELEWHEPRFLRRSKISNIHLFDDEDLHISLEPRKRKALEFKDQYRFNWFPKNKPKAKLFIRLFLSGRKKSLVLKVLNQ